MPHMHPTPRYINHKLPIEHAIPPSANPMNNRMDDNNDASLMWFSTKDPNVAAPIPRKKIFRQKVNLTISDVCPMQPEMGFTNKLKE